MLYEVITQAMEPLKAGNEVSDVISRRGTFVTLFDPLPALHVNGVV